MLAQRRSVGSDFRHIIARLPFVHWIFQTFGLSTAPQSAGPGALRRGFGTALGASFLGAITAPPCGPFPTVGPQLASSVTRTNHNQKRWKLRMGSSGSGTGRRSRRIYPIAVRLLPAAGIRIEARRVGIVRYCLARRRASSFCSGAFENVVCQHSMPSPSSTSSCRVSGNDSGSAGVASSAPPALT